MVLAYNGDQKVFVDGRMVVVVVCMVAAVIIVAVAEQW